ncbi:TetR/AcrR family transcriptional regulator [Promicromonospora panici]|uniref:TetR/AcrR family transcriptional regulator n=1 Tax=Promicromonospora panici TaxID=2219658 RepID=UPI0013ECB2E6|nr:TetR/AcrR family transcriptional regulator [Promicromonospora panici]
MSAEETTPNDSPAPGLRELKKQMTRDGIAAAAFQLTLEKGLDHVTIEEISRIAIVSPRTFSNYFSSKEEAVVSAGAQEPEQFVPTFREALQEAPPLQALREVFSDFFMNRTDEQLDHIREMLALVEQYPSLLDVQTARFGNIEAELRAVVAEHTGTDAETDMYPWLVASAGVAGIKAALRVWGSADDGRDRLVKLVHEALNLFSEGLPVPAGAGGGAGRA